MRELFWGDVGEDVRALQVALQSLAFPLPEYGADGVYGPETEAACRAFCVAGHYEDCSWGLAEGEPPLPVWVQEKVLQAAEIPPVVKAWVPSGSGMFIQSLHAVKDLARVRAAVEVAGISWVAIQAGWQYDVRTTRQYNWPEKMGPFVKSYGCTDGGRAIIEEFLRLGVDVLPFVYPVPGKEQEAVDLLGAYREAWGSRSVIVDAESPFKGDRGAHEESARKLARLCGESFSSWGMTSYGATWYHGTFPFAAFRGATYGMPQTYTNYWLGDGLYEKAHIAYRAMLGEDTPMVHLYGTYSKTSAELGQMVRMLMNDRTMTASCGWKWGSTSEVEWDVVERLSAHFQDWKDGEGVA